MTKLRNVYQRCDCGHENRLHASNAGDAGACQMMGCPCTTYHVAQQLAAPRKSSFSERQAAKAARASWARKMPHGGRR